jgi:hypothetical protein
LTVDVKKGVPGIPESALVATTKGYLAYVVTEGQAEQRDVTVGLRKVGRVEITEGLEVGEAVVTEGHQRVSAGRKVEIVKREDVETAPDNEVTGN